MKPPTIVLVEHDDDVLEVLRRVCDVPGFLIAHAGDADAAMHYIVRHTPAAIIVPHQISDDARGWIARARRAAPDALILVTGAQDDAVLGAGADVVLAAADEPSLARELAVLCAKDAPGEHPGRTSLVIVEPDAQLATVMTRWLGGSFDVRVVSTGWRAVEVIREALPDAMLCELRLPDMDASELYEVVRRTVPDLADRILFMTGGFVADRAQQFLARIPGQWIEKPFDLTRLRRALLGLFG